MAKLKFILDGAGKKIYPITIANGVAYIKKNAQGIETGQTLLSDELDKINSSLGKKVELVKGTADHFVSFIDATGAIKDSGKSAADFATAAQGKKADSAIQSVKVNGAALTADANKAVDILIATGTANGNIAVNGKDVAVKGLGTAAYTASSAYDVAGAAATAKTEAISTVQGTTDDTKESKTIEGAKKYAEDLVNTKFANIANALVYKGTVKANGDLPTDATTGATYVVATAGTYAGQAMEVGDFLIWDGSKWNGVNGENQVSNENASLKIGSAVTVATVDGTDIKVTQVEDTTKLECQDSGDTTEYTDVAALFSSITPQG